MGKKPYEINLPKNTLTPQHKKHIKDVTVGGWKEAEKTTKKAKLPKPVP